MCENMNRFKKLFPKACSVIGMVHVRALPGAPKYTGSIRAVIKQACADTEAYLSNGIQGILVENMHDVPYIHRKHVGPETTASMSRICAEIRRIAPSNIPCGVQILAGANKEALAVAQACEFQFIRAEGFVFGHIADEGYMDASAGTLLRYRKLIGADDVAVFCDIKKKHSSHAITSDVSLEETAEAAEFFLADGVVLTGKSTGNPTEVSDLERVKLSCNLPVLIGSGVTLENARSYRAADALIVGSHFKTTGRWDSEICDERVSNFMCKVRSLQ